MQCVGFDADSGLPIVFTMYRRGAGDDWASVCSGELHMDYLTRQGCQSSRFALPMMDSEDVELATLEFTCQVGNNSEAYPQAVDRKSVCTDTADFLFANGLYPAVDISRSPSGSCTSKPLVAESSVRRLSSVCSSDSRVCSDKERAIRQLEENAFDPVDSTSLISFSLWDSDAVHFHCLRLSVFGANGLFNSELMGKLDPYLVVLLGDQRLETEPMTNAGVDAEFSYRFEFVYAGERYLNLQVWDHERLLRSQQVGQVVLDIEEWIQSSLNSSSYIASRIDAEIRGPDGLDGGRLRCHLEISHNRVAGPLARQLPPFDAGVLHESPEEMAPTASEGMQLEDCPFGSILVTLLSIEHLKHRRWFHKMTCLLTLRWAHEEVRLETFVPTSMEQHELDRAVRFPLVDSRYIRINVFDFRSASRSDHIAWGVIDVRAAMVRQLASGEPASLPLRVEIEDAEGENSYLNVVVQFDHASLPSQLCPVAV